MPEKTYSQVFNGYWREVNKNGLPAASGVYCVYEATYNRTANSVVLHRLIYIGESENIRNRIATHEKTNEWKRYVRYGNELCFSSSLVNGSDRLQVEAALIYEHKPPVNTEYKYEFPFDTTTIYTSGCNAFIRDSFTVHSTNKSFANFYNR